VVTDDLSGGFFIEPGLLFLFKPAEVLILSLSTAYKNISGSRGDSTYKVGSQTQTENIGGAGYSAFTIGLMLKSVW
jgi:hypothetical protein